METTHRQIVVTGVAHDESRVISEHDPIRIVDDVGHGGPPEAAIQDRYPGKIGRHVGPVLDRGAADEDDAGEWQRVGAVGRLEGADLCFEASGILIGIRGRTARLRAATGRRSRPGTRAHQEQDGKVARESRADRHFWFLSYSITSLRGACRRQASSSTSRKSSFVTRPSRTSTVG